jgi:hypothetical protein
MDEYGISCVKLSHPTTRIYFCVLLARKTYLIVFASACPSASRKHTALATENLYLLRSFSQSLFVLRTHVCHYTQHGLWRLVQCKAVVFMTNLTQPAASFYLVMQVMMHFAYKLISNAFVKMFALRDFRPWRRSKRDLPCTEV